MSAVDARGCELSGATPAALESYERALAALVAWRGDAAVWVERALEEAPGFQMAHALRAYLLVSGRDPRRVRAAGPLLAHAALWPANERERLHLAAIGAVVGDDYEQAKAHLGQALARWPRDILALHVAHGFDHVTGDFEGMRRRVASVLPAWHGAWPARHAVLAMHAFALEECGKYAAAENEARAALALRADDARAHHVMAHVFEMTDRPEAGVRWMTDHVADWGVDTMVATHGHWHVALFHLSCGRVDRALALYDQRVRAGSSVDIADLIDATALLWRIELAGAAAGRRWRELAAAWDARIEDRFCSFNDLHAMLAFVGARDGERARRLEGVLEAGARLPSRHGETTRWLGLAAARAVRAFGRGDDGRAISLLASLPARAQRLGGSHAQRDLFALTMRSALDRLCRPWRRVVSIGARIAGSAVRGGRTPRALRVGANPGRP
jgi:tetratricopeptide (TPR) repeat protein